MGSERYIGKSRHTPIGLRTSPMYLPPSISAAFRREISGETYSVVVTILTTVEVVIVPRHCLTGS
jgi:hypothetical protein